MGADPTPSKSPSAPSANKVYTSDDITTMTKEKKCLCGRCGHTLDKCGVPHHAGFCIVLDKTKAQEHWNEVRPPRNKSGGGKGGSAAAASPAPASAATPPSSVGGASHASGTMFAALDSDDDIGLDQDSGVSSYARAASGHKVKSAFAPYLPSLVDSCIASSSHVALSVASPPSRSVLIADSGATDHMWPHFEPSPHTHLSPPNMSPWPTTPMLQWLA
jgi:hypothetical protein